MSFETFTNAVAGSENEVALWVSHRLCNHLVGCFAAGPGTCYFHECSALSFYAETDSANYTGGFCGVDTYLQRAGLKYLPRYSGA